MIFHKGHRTCRSVAAGGFTFVEAVVAIALIGVGVASTLGALTKFNSIAATSRNATGAAAVLINQIDLFQSMGPFNPQKALIPKDTVYPMRPTYDMTVGTNKTIYYKDPTLPAAVPPTEEWPVYREPARWNYDNAAARTGATGFLTTDLGQLAYQRDTRTYYRLQTTAPTWTQDDTGGLIVKGTMTSTVTDISTAAMPNTYRAVFTIGYTYGSRDRDPITGLGKGGPIWNPTSNPPRWEYQLSMTAIRTSDL